MDRRMDTNLAISAAQRTASRRAITKVSLTASILDLILVMKRVMHMESRMDTSRAIQSGKLLDTQRDSRWGGTMA